MRMIAIAARTGLRGSTALCAALLPSPAALAAGEIIVTASRRAENIQQAPISVAAFGGETLARLGVQSANDLPQIMPGLSQTRALVGVNAFLRGVGAISAGYSTESPVATYVDGLYLPNSAAASFAFNDVERIEVLKGPQGTLYGRNATGGLIHVITRDPGRDPALDMSASYGNYGTTQLNFYGSAPLGETLAANLAAVRIDQDKGWGRNLFTGKESFTFKDFGAQGKLVWRPAPDTRITLRAFYDRTSSDEGVAAFPYPGTVGADGSRFLGWYAINLRLDPTAVQRQYTGSLRLEQDLGFATFTSTTGYIHNRSNALTVQSANRGNLVPGQGAVNLGGDQRARTFSQEFQLASAASTPVAWIVGAFYYHDETRISADVYGACVGAVCAPPTPTRTDGYQDTESRSAYADGAYAITPTTRLTLGIRHTRDTKTLRGLVRPLAGFPNSAPAFPATVVARPGQAFAGFPNGIDTAVTFAKLTYRAVLAQDIGETVNLYASYNRGFKSGGFNPTSFTNPASRPEVLDAFELGVKSRTADRVLTLNASAFYYDYKDIQLRTSAPPAPPGGTLLLNAARARIKGVDIDAAVTPIAGLSLTGAVEFLDARYVDFPGGVCTMPRAIGGAVLGGTTSAACDLSGRRLPSAPRFSYALGVNYACDTDLGRFEIDAADGYKSHYFWEPNNRLRQNSFHVVNAAVTWTPPRSRFSAQVYGRNLTGDYYLASGAGGPGGNDGGLPAPPRTYGAKMRYRF